MRIRCRQNLPFNLERDKTYQVWWYGCLRKNLKDPTVPQVMVFFREINARGLAETFLPRTVGLDSLALLRIGSTWRNGEFVSDAPMEEKTFEVDFSQDKWSFASPSLSRGYATVDLINPWDYPLNIRYDKNWLIDFPLDDGKNLLVPCIEFFVRCYGASMEASRVLAAYPWEEVEKRFYAPFDTEVPAGHWPVKLKKRLRNDDVILLAHMLYDGFAKRMGKSIYAQIEANFRGNSENAFIKVGPWFQGAATLMVKGHWINEGRSFLALQIVGCSDPQGPPILRDRANTNKALEGAAGEDVDIAWTGAPLRVIKGYLPILDLTDDAAPDHSSGILDVKAREFIVPGMRRVVTDVKRLQAKTKTRLTLEDTDSKTFSSGEPGGTGKGVGQASICSPVVMESHGALMDMWNALRFLQEKNSETIKSIKWFTFTDGFRDTPEPRLISLVPFERHTPRPNRGSNHWAYVDPSTRTPRGILVVQVTTPDKIAYLVEIQRRPRKKKVSAGEAINSEESFKGLVFMLNEQQQFTWWLRDLLLQIRRVNGVVQKLVKKCPGKAAAYVHAPAGNDRVSCEAAAVNALRKVGIELRG